MKASSTKRLALGGILSIGLAGQSAQVTARKSKTPAPNFVIILADDMGYGDIGVYGHPTIRTPHLDRMANEGQKWTNFYVAAPVCTPSRAGLLTGRLPIRSGMCSEKRRVLFPDSKGGLPQTEITIASALKGAGYTTACVGKWHLGHLPQSSPKVHGFDDYFGIPYSNDMDRISQEKDALTRPKIDYFNVPLMRNSEVIERPADQTTISKRYTEEAVKFIERNTKRPFFLYLAHSMPHVPLFRSPEFENRSLRGIYGDVIEELDGSVGRVLEALRKNGLENNTYVVFVSDNGPWLTYKEQGGSAGLLSGGKGGTYEGGMREPAIFWSPGKIKPGVVMELGTTLDLFPTVCRLAGLSPPKDRIYDGYDISPVLAGNGPSPRGIVYFYRDTDIFAIRRGAFKAHFFTQSEYGPDQRARHDPPLLFDLNVDPSEKYNIADQHPEVIDDIRKILEAHQATVTPVENQIEK